MIKKNICLIITVLAVIIYVYLQINVFVEKTTGESPVMTFDENLIYVTVNANESTLLKGVIVKDREDGDISDKVEIENLSPFTSNNTRIVNYVVFDSDGNVTKGSRMIKYNDYTAPTFSIVSQLKGDTYSFSDLTNKIKARSSVDGDISSKVSIKNANIEGQDSINVQLVVTDSTNTASYLNVTYHLEPNLPIDISLKNYLVYLKQGEEFEFRDHIKFIVERDEEINDMIQYVDIEIPDMSEPGTYEVVYKLERSNGNIGKSILNVVVE